MNETTEWIDKKYDEVFEEELRGLQRRKTSDQHFSLNEVQGTLKNLYIMYGNNWDGRGEVAQVGLSATIAAHEVFIENEQKSEPI